MTLSSIFDSCVPRPDVIDGSFSESDFAADLAAVLRGEAPNEYCNPAKFFAQTYPTDGLKTLLANICSRLSGAGDSMAPIFRLDTNYGGGKTHALIALAHAAQGMKGVTNITEFIEPAKLPSKHVRVAAFDGENADPNNGRPLGDSVRAYTPWGELAYALAGKTGYEIVRKSDESGAAPGADTIKELFGGEPALILLDELSIYLRKLRPSERDRSGGQMTAFLTSLFKAVESSPNAAVVYTLAIGKDGIATDAYSQENQFIADAMEEAESVSARKATLLNPTEEDETVKVLQRRLFQHVDECKARDAVDEFRHLWDHNKPLLPYVGVEDKRVATFLAGYPFHPELLDTLRNKTATLSNFQRVRGMLRLLGRTIGRLWAQRPEETYAIQLHHMNPAYEPIRQEIVTRLGQRALVPALRADVAATEGESPSLAQQIDINAYAGLPPYASYVARTAFFHTMAFNDPLKGATREQVRYSVLAPGKDISFIDDAITRFLQQSAYLDDRPNVPLRFQHEANLTQIIKRQEEQVDQTEVRNQLRDRIREIFSTSRAFNAVPFASGPFDVTDDSGDGKPALVIIGYDAAEISGLTVQVPELVDRIYRYQGSGTTLRVNRNNLAFLLADSERKAEVKRKMTRHLALKDLLSPERLNELAEHQREKMRELSRRSEQELALAIQQCYRHVLYPSKNRIEGTDVDLAHAAIEVHTASQSPGDGQRHIVQVLRECKKLRLPEDDPDSPSYIRDRTPLRKGEVTTAKLRNEFFRDPALPMLVGNETFLRGLRQGIETGEYVYQSGELTWAKGAPFAEIKIDENSIVYTTAHAKDQGIWPKTEPAQPSPAPSPSSGSGSSFNPSLGAGSDFGSGPQPPSPTSGSTLLVGQSNSEVSSEGPLKEALTSLWEKAKSKGLTKIGLLSLKLYDSTDAFRVMVQINGIPKATKQVKIEGGYETVDGGELSVEFSGPVDDAHPVKAFLEPQLRAAKEKDLQVLLEVTFTEGMDLSSDEPEKLTEKLGKFGSGAALVSAVAKGQDA